MTIALARRTFRRLSIRLPRARAARAALAGWTLALCACMTREPVPRLPSPSVLPGATLDLHFFTPRVIDAVRPVQRADLSPRLDTIRLTDVRDLRGRFQAQHGDTLLVQVHNLPRDRGEPAWARTASIVLTPGDRVELIRVDKANTTASVVLITLAVAGAVFWYIVHGLSCQAEGGCT